MRKADSKIVRTSGYGFVTDTESYAGNFERETVAHITGEYGDCEVGKATAHAARRELKATAEGRRFRSWCRKHVARKTDENGCSRPAAIYPTPGWLNDGHGNAYRAEDANAPAVRDKYLETVRGYHEPLVARSLALAAVEDAAGNKDQADAWRRDAESHRKSIADAEARGSGRYDSFQSVIVWLNRRPPAWVLAVMKARATAFLTSKRKWSGPDVVSGFRVVKIVETTKAWIV